MISQKRNIIIAAVILIIFVGSIFGYGIINRGDNKSSKNTTKMPTGNVISFSDYPDDMASMFLCPCCGKVIDRKNICCGMASDMIGYIDSLIASGLSKDEVVMKAVEKYGINSVVESKRAEVQAALAKKNPSAFPEGKLLFSSAIGEKVPDFTLESIEGKTVKLSDYKGKVIVLFFTEGSMCYPACWDQIAAFGNDERFNNDETVVFSITPDQKAEWQKIVEKVPNLAKAKILFDSTRAVSTAYDVLSLPSSMHKGSYPGHTYFIIGKDMNIRYVLDDPAMAIQNDRIAAEISKL